MRCLRHARRLDNPTPPSRLVITTISPQVRITIIPPCRRVPIPLMRHPTPLPPLHIRIPLNNCRDAPCLANIAAKRKRLVGTAAADIARF